MTPTSAPNAVFLLAADHRAQLRDVARRLGIFDDAKISDFKRHVVTAVVAVNRQRPPASGRAGVLLDTDLGREAIADANRAGISVGIPIETSGSYPLALTDDWHEILETQPSWIKVRIARPRGARAPALWAVQDATLLEASRACAATGVQLLVEPLLLDEAGTPGSLSAEDGCALAAWISELRQAGVLAAWWKVQGAGSAQTADAVAAACDPTPLVILGQGATLPELSRWFGHAASSAGYRGFAVGRSIYAPAFEQHLAGISAETVIAEITKRLEAVLDLWEKTRKP